MNDIAPTTSSKPPATLELERIARHTLPTAVLGMTVTPDGTQAYVACFDGVYALDLESGKYDQLYAHESYASGVVRDPLGKWIISGGYDGQLIWFDLQRRSIVRRVLAHEFWSWQLALSPDGRQLATVTGQYLAGGERYEPAAETEPSVKLFDTFTGRMLHAFSMTPSVQAVAFSPDGQFVAAANLLGEVSIWETASGRLSSSGKSDDFTSWGVIKSHCYIGGIFALQFSPHAEQLLAAGMGPMHDPMAGNGRQLWQRFEWGSPALTKVDEIRKEEAGEGLMETLACHPRHPLFVMGGRLRGGDWNAALFSLETGARLTHLNTGYRMTASAFSGPGDFLITAGADRQKAPENGTFPDFGVVDRYRLRGLADNSAA